MDFLRRIEDDVRNLGVESKRKHPEVREAAERALLTLRTMRESYVSEVMRGSGSDGSNSGGDDSSRGSPRIAKFRSAEVSAPYVLACGTGEVEMPLKLVKLALNGIQILLNYEVVPPSEASNILRVLLVQSHSTSADVQLKVLQIVLQLANALAADVYSNQYLTVENVREMLQLSIQLCNARTGMQASSSSGGFGSSYYSSIMGSSTPSTLPPGAANIAVASTAFATVRQILALIMDATVESMAAAEQEVAGGGGDQTASSANAQQLPVCAEMFLKDLSLFVRRKAGQWLVGVTFDFGSALDLLHEILGGWPELFVRHQIFHTLFQHTLCAALMPLLRTLPVDYVEAHKYQLLVGGGGGGGDSIGNSSSGGGSGTSPGSYIAGKDGSATATVTKIARIARCILLHYPHTGEFLATADSMASVMLQALHPDRENDLLLKTLPGNVLDGTVTGGGTVLVDGSVSHSLVMLTECVADHAEQNSAPVGQQSASTHSSSSSSSSGGGGIGSSGISSSGGGIGSSHSHNSTTSPSLISRLTSTSKMSQQTKEQIAYFSRTTSGGIVLPLSSACNYSFNYLHNSATSASDGILALNSGNVPKFNFIACHPAAVGLEALLAFLLSEDDLCVQLAASDAGESSLVTVLTSVILSVTSTLTEALMIDANIRDFEIITKNSLVIPLVDNILSHNNEQTWQDLQAPSNSEGSSSDAGGGSRFDAAKAKQSRLASLRTLRDHLFSHGSTLTSGDVLLLGFLSLQVVCRHLAKSALLVSDLKTQATASSSNQATHSASKASRTEHVATFFPASTNGSIICSPLGVPTPSPRENSEEDISAHLLQGLMRSTVATFERTGDRLNEACTALLCRCNGEHFENSMNVTRRTLNMLAEATLSCGLLGLQRQGDVLVSTLCRFAVPRWQAQDFLVSSVGDHTSRESLQGGGMRDSLSRGDLAERESICGGGSGLAVGPRLKKRHIQSFVRLTQVVHVLADTINDWDTIMDCFEQIAQFLITRHRLSQGQGHDGRADQQEAGGGLTLNDTEKIFQCIERFKGYTVFMSDETIVKLMTSLVALSVNSLSTTPSNVNDTPFSSASYPQGSSSQGTHNDNSANNKESSSESNPLSISMRNFLKRNISGSEYMLESLGSGHLHYSLHMAIEIVKINAFRVSCIWQMVTSHLRILASHKLPRTRVVAVAATNDIITNTLEYMRNPSVDHSYTKKVVLLSPLTATASSSHTYSSPVKTGGKPVNSNTTSAATAAGWSDYFAFFFAHVTDSTLYEDVLPPYQTVFMGRSFQELALKAKSKMSGQGGSSGAGGSGSASAVSSRRLQLTQADLLSSLRGLANIKYGDVRVDIMQGLLEMLEGGGQAVTGGWGIIIELLTAVPASMLPVEADCDSDGHSSPGLESEHRNSPLPPQAQAVPWPVQALLTAFSCLTLIVDDFLETLRTEDSSSLTNLVTCLSMFSRQSYDVNISLTSVQMLWKVTDFVMTASREKGDEATTNAVLNVMLQQLLELSLDLRPEIRNCATNTLFSAIVSNASMLSSAQWRNAFQEVIFPLFRRMETRSSEAMRSNEEALAPEIKKGVKMAVHHSRDTAHKQWSETRIFALRGLSRVVKICLRLLVVEEWFQDTWLQALDLCIGAVQSDPLSGQQGGVQHDLEVSLAGVDTVFDLLKMVSSSGSYRAKTRAAQGMRVVGGALVSDPSSTAGGSSSSASSGISGGDDSSASKSSTDIELIATRELAQQQLWQLAWSAVKVSSCFTCSGWDLPLHICKHLRELYVGGTEAEFRYSQNIQSMLEVLVILARPRLLVEVSGPVDSGSGGACLLKIPVTNDHVAQPSRLGTMTAAQLQRAIMDMLKSVHPKDTVSFSCLVTCIAELCFHGQFYAQMPNIDLNHFHSAGHGPAGGNGSHTSKTRVVFAPVHASLREEVEGYMLAMLQGAPDVPPAASAGCANPAKKNKVVVVDPFYVPFRPVSNPRNNVWFTTALHILSREFVAANCQPASMSRLGLMFPGVVGACTAQDETHSAPGCEVMSDKRPHKDVLRTVAGDKAEGTTKRGSFLVSLAKMMSLSIEYDDDEQDIGLDITGRDSLEERELRSKATDMTDKDLSGNSFATDNCVNIKKDHSSYSGGASNANGILKLMKLRVSRSVAEDSAVHSTADDDDEDNDDDDDEAADKSWDGGSWGCFHNSHSSLRLLAAVVGAGLPALRSSGMPATQSQLILRNCLFISACLMSPWSHSRELNIALPISSPSGAPTSSDQLSNLPNRGDVLALPSPQADGAVGQDVVLADNVCVLMSALATHMRTVHESALSISTVSPESRSGPVIPLVQAWVQVLVHSSQLICWALVGMQQHALSANVKGATSTDESGDSGSLVEKAAPFSYFISMLEESKTHLFELIEGESDAGGAGVVLQTMALGGVHQVLSSMVELCTPEEFHQFDATDNDRESAHAAKHVPSPRLHLVCASFLQSACDVCTSAAMLPTRSLAAPPGSLRVALARWLQDMRGLHVPPVSHSTAGEVIPTSPQQATLLAQVAPVASVYAVPSATVATSDSDVNVSPKARGDGPSGSASTSTSHTSTGKNHSEASRSPAHSRESTSAHTAQRSEDLDDGSPLLNSSGHLFLFSDMASRLVYSSHPQLRATAMRTLRAVDSAALLVAYNASLRKVALLETKNARLTEELNAIKSAASFQF